MRESLAFASVIVLLAVFVFAMSNSKPYLPEPKDEELASLTPEEEDAWVAFFEEHWRQGRGIAMVDQLAWADLCLRFPRLRAYKGVR